MPVTLAMNRSKFPNERRAALDAMPAESESRSDPKLVIGLLNNMSSIEATERQFTTLLESASQGRSIRLKRYFFPEVAQGELAATYAERGYESVESLGGTELDGLIVTGREPLAASLRDEPYWASFVRVLEWARENTCSAVWSCLAAHAAVLSMDNIQRVKSERKHSGVLGCTRVSTHPIAADIPERFQVPHSRWNGLTESDLDHCGYEVISRTDNAGVDCFVRQERSLFLFFQGHPEYEVETLLLEYRRDIGRFLRGESTNYPNIPFGSFDSETEQRLAEIQNRAAAQNREETIAQLAAIFSAITIRNGWHSTASTFYRNWFQYIESKKRLAQSDREAAAISPEEMCESLVPASVEPLGATAL